MSLWVETRGTGRDLVFLHGWGFNSAVWHPVAEQLIKDYRVSLIDLPGFGRSANVASTYKLDELIELLMPHIPKNAMLLGWSMGGLIAQGLALKYPDHLEKLILLSSNAQFVADDNWPNAMQRNVLDGFMGDLVENFSRTLQVFLMLQAQGGDHVRETVRQLKTTLYAHGEPDEAALRGGLLLLKNTRFVSQLSEFKLPVYLLNGRLDRIVPLPAAEAMLKKIPRSKLHVFENASHAPFISHYSEFMTVLREVMKERALGEHL